VSFFLLRDRETLKEKAINKMSIFIPKSKEKINSIIYFIRRYFLGLCLQTIIMFTLFGIGMMICGIPNPWTFALFAAVINVIPYFGPLIGFLFTVTLVGTFSLGENTANLIWPLITKSFFLFGIVQMIDNLILQPTIFSRALKAHPLEIFFVIFAAGFIGGIMWMIIAMPIYTIFRIIFSELTTKFK
jgi:predicted PurR-regulated permease PerM